jgi:hypothetical protein
MLLRFLKDNKKKSNSLNRKLLSNKNLVGQRNFILEEEHGTFIANIHLYAKGARFCGDNSFLTVVFTLVASAADKDLSTNF